MHHAHSSCCNCQQLLSTAVADDALCLQQCCQQDESPTSRSTAPARRGSRPATKSVCTSSTLSIFKGSSTKNDTHWFSFSKLIKLLCALYRALQSSMRRPSFGRQQARAHTCAMHAQAKQSATQQCSCSGCGLTPCAFKVASVASSAAVLISVAMKLAAAPEF
jgi:hypothetical protein